MTTNDDSDRGINGPDQAYLAKVVECIIDGIVTINEVGTIETVNAAIEKMFGYTPDQLIGQNIKILMPERYSQEHDGYLVVSA
jgi:PAS domain S-box-containing protein